MALTRNEEITATIGQELRAGKKELIDAIVKAVKEERSITARARAVSPACLEEVLEMVGSRATSTQIERCITRHAVSRHTGNATGRPITDVDADALYRTFTGGPMLHTAVDNPVLSGEPVKRTIPEAATTTQTTDEKFMLSMMKMVD